MNQLPLSQVHPSMWKGANQKFHVYPTRQQHAEKVNKEKSVDGKLRIVSSLSKNESKKRKKLESLGIDYNFPGYDALIKVYTDVFLLFFSVLFPPVFYPVFYSIFYIFFFF